MNRKERMANKEKIDYLLLDIRELEKQVAGMRDAEVYPVSFFSQTFDLTHKILNELHALETTQLEQLRKQMEEHAALIQNIPQPIAKPQPVVEKSEPKPLPTPEPIIQPDPAPMQVVEPTPTAEPESASVPVAEPESVIEHEVIPTDTKVSLSLNDQLEKKILSDFRKAFSLNDRFRFRRELFGGNEEKMNMVIADLNDIQSYEEAMDYLNNILKWNLEDPAVTDFIKMLEKRYL